FLATPKVLTGLSVLATISLSTPAFGQVEAGRIRINKTAANRPLRSLRDVALKERFVVNKEPITIHNFQLPSVAAGNALQRGPDAPDLLLQDTVGIGATSVLRAFDGASNDDNANLVGGRVTPPDTDGVVGPNHFLQMTNLVTLITDKNGNTVSGPFVNNAFWDGIGGLCEPNNSGDPIVLYDESADRWIVTQFAIATPNYAQCVAVSQTGDPTGGYNRYEFSFNNVGFNDYPKHGITNDSVTLMANIFTPFGGSFIFGGTFLGTIDKNAMYAGQPASLLGENLGSSEFGFVAGDLDGPGTATALFGTAMSRTGLFDIWELIPNYSAGTYSLSRIAAIPIASFNSTLCSGSRGACIPQPGTSIQLESLAGRLMPRLQIRDFGSYRTMLTAHTINVGGGRAGIRWYEMRQVGSGPWTLFQEGTYAPNDGQNRFMPSIAMNAAGDIGIGYLVGSSNTFLSTAVTGQTAANSGSNLFDSDELFCANGSGPDTNASRAGDYSATSVDPLTDSFWHTNEYIGSGGLRPWQTTICEFTVSSGGGPVNQRPIASFTDSCTDLTCSFDGSGSTDPDGTIVAFAWDFGDGTTASGATPSKTYASAGSFDVTLTVTDDDGATDSETRTVTVNAPPTGGCFYTGTFEATSDGWFTGGGNSCSTGTFVRGTPNQQTTGGLITQVGGAAVGTGAWFTAPNASLGNADVDGGTCETLSPSINASSASAVEVSLSYFHGQRDAGDDSTDGLTIEVLNNGVVVDTIVDIGDVQTGAAWTNVSSVVGDPGNIQLRVRATDGPGPGDIVEAGIDEVSICPSDDPPPPPPPTCTTEIDFESGAAGWANSGASTCSTGSFVVANPTEQIASGVVTQPDGAAGGTGAYFTATNTSIGNADVDGGTCIANSPSFTVSEASILSVDYFHGQRDAGDDPSGDFFALEVSTNGGASFQAIASNGDSQSTAVWQNATTTIPAGSNVVVRIRCSDGAGPGDIVECGIDNFSICPQ
ncbi:MAG: PKD domain-containing protein, partial [Myxococcota bacterium]